MYTSIMHGSVQMFEAPLEVRDIRTLFLTKMIIKYDMKISEIYNICPNIIYRSFPNVRPCSMFAARRRPSGGAENKKHPPRDSQYETEVQNSGTLFLNKIIIKYEKYIKNIQCIPK